MARLCIYVINENGSVNKFDQVHTMLEFINGPVYQGDDMERDLNKILEEAKLRFCHLWIYFFDDKQGFLYQFIDDELMIQRPTEIRNIMEDPKTWGV